MVKIENIIAQDKWYYKNKDGKTVSAEIIIGKPSQKLHEEKPCWVCPVYIETFTTRVISAVGAGPVEALLSAMTLVKAFFDMYQECFVEHVPPKPKEPQARTASLKRKRNSSVPKKVKK